MVKKDISIGLIIKNSIKSIIQDPGYILIYLLPLIISIFAMIHMWIAVGADLTNIIQKQNYQTGNFQDILFTMMVLGFIYVLLSFIVATISLGGLIKKVVIQEKGKKMSFNDAFRSGLETFPRLFVSNILGTLLIAVPIFGILGFVFFATTFQLLCLSMLVAIILFFPLIYIAIRFSFFAQICIIDELKPIACFKKSWSVTKGKVISIFVFILILISILIAITIPFMILNDIGVDYMSTIGNIINIIFFGPLYGIAFTLFYIRILKKEKPKKTI